MRVVRWSAALPLSPISASLYIGTPSCSSSVVAMSIAHWTQALPAAPAGAPAAAVTVALAPARTAASLPLAHGRTWCTAAHIAFARTDPSLVRALDDQPGCA